MLLSTNTYFKTQFSSSACVDIPYVEKSERKTREYGAMIQASQPKYELQIRYWLLKCETTTNSDSISFYFRMECEKYDSWVIAYIYVDGTTIERCFRGYVKDSRNVFLGEIVECEPMSKNDIRIRCHIVLQEAEARIIPQLPSLSLSLFDALGVCQNNESDAEIHVGEEVIQIHRGYFGMLSPVFYAMFNHDTEEKRTGIVNVKDIDSTTVQNAVNFCYGQCLKEKTTAELLNVLTFGDKYDIKAIPKIVTPRILQTLNPFNFCLILNYAWTTSNEELKNKCVEYYRDNVDPIALTLAFGLLDKEVLCGLIQSVKFNK